MYATKAIANEEMAAALDKVLEQGNQLRASELIPALKEIVKALQSQ